MVKLPEKFAKWEELANQLVPLLKKNKYRETIDNELELIGNLYIDLAPSIRVLVRGE